MSDDKPAATTSSVTLERADAADKKDKVCGSRDGRVLCFFSFNAAFAAHAQEKEPDPPMASLGELYQFLSVPQKLLLSLCACFGLGAGTAMPLMMLTFKSMFETLGACLLYTSPSPRD